MPSAGLSIFRANGFQAPPQACQHRFESFRGQLANASKEADFRTLQERLTRIRHRVSRRRATAYAP
jgi:hypothetical protein